jgi:hypothetical protein
MAVPLRATFYTFRRHGERGGVLLAATLVTTVLAIALIGLGVLLGWPVLSLLFSAASTGESLASEQVSSLFAGIGAYILFLFVITFALYVLFAAYEAACLRWMIRREAPGLFGLDLGADTWRVYSSYWVWFFVNLGVSMAASLVATPFMFLAMAPIASSGSDAALASLIALQVLISVVQNAAMIFVSVRLAPAAATSIARKRFAFFEAWKVTRGRFWALFGSFFVLMLGNIVLTLIVLAVGVGAIVSVFDGVAPTPETLMALFTPANLSILATLYALILVASLVYVVLSFGVNARAVIAAVDEGKIAGQSPNVAEVFS